MTDPDTDARAAKLADEAEAAAYRDMCRAAPAEFVRATGLRSVEVGGATLILAPGIPTTMFNRAIGLGIFRPASEADLDDVIAEIRRTSCGKFWIHLNPSARPPRLESWLAGRGLRLARRRAWAKVLFEGSEPPSMKTSLTVREVDEARADELAAVLTTAFEMPALFSCWFHALVGRPNWHAVAGFRGEQMVCGGFLYRERDFAWLGVAGTLPGFRGRGGQRAVMARRMRIALQHGARGIVTETGEPVGDEPNPSLANMRRCGFRQVCSRLNYEPG